MAQHSTSAYILGLGGRILYRAGRVPTPKQRPSFDLGQKGIPRPTHCACMEFLSLYKHGVTFPSMIFQVSNSHGCLASVVLSCPTPGHTCVHVFNS
eukprot:5472920-Amphidinium_carterae.1